MYLHIDKLDSIQIEPVAISATGLVPNLNYEFQLRLHHSAGTFSSRGTFKADEKGTIDLTRDEPFKGYYTGLRPMGLFESIQPLQDYRLGNYCKCSPPDPWKLELVLYDCNGTKMDSLPFIKRWIHPDVERTEIDADGIKGVLFKPPGPGPFPSIIDISGTGGGVQEHKGATLSSAGFCVFSLGYFQYKDLPTTLSDVDMEYFVRAADWFSSLPFTTDRVGVQGVSFGGAIVNLWATRSDKIKCVCAINGPHTVTYNAFIQENGEPLKCSEPNNELYYYVNGTMCYDKLMQHLEVTDESDWKMERAPKDVEFRYVVSVDDLSTSSLFSASTLAQRLRESGHKVEMEMVPGGHLMEPPYFPHHGFVYSKFSDSYMAYGGESNLHGISQMRVWQNTLAFFTRNLGQPKPPKHYMETTKSHL